MFLRAKPLAITVLTLMTLSLLMPASFAASSGPAPEPQELSIQLGAPFCDNAILQRDMEVPVWGWSTPGTKVTVEFAGQKKTAEAGEDGKWVVKLDEMKASFEPREMVITESTGWLWFRKELKTVTLKNILVGEVWMASGQSNMQWTCTKSSVNKLCGEFKTMCEEKGLKVSPIREFRVNSVTSQLHPIEKATGNWKDGNYLNYSAIAFAFAEKLYQELQVPIGILNCSFSQTAIQAWVPREGWASAEDDYSKAINEECLKTDPRTPEHKEAWGAFYKSLEDQIAASEAAVKQGKKAKEISENVPGNMKGNRDANWLYCGKLSPVVPYAIRGAIWNQGYANMGEGLPYYNNLHSLIRGWRIVWDRTELPVYFHQFYCPGSPSEPSIGSTSEMRLGTWMARDIPNANMASQIDISGAIHYGNKTVPGRRLARLALKNQYPSTELRAGGNAKDMVAEGPMFKSYQVKGDEVIVEFTNTEGGIVVADTEFNRKSQDEAATGYADPKIIKNGEDKVKLFWLAGEDRVWHPAAFEIKGDKVVVKSKDVKKPRGVSYGSGGIGFQPCLYNKDGLLPMTPFIQYDNKMVTSKWWPDEKLKIAGEKIDPSSVGLLYEWRKMPILSVQFRDNAVFQADKPVTIWGSTQQYGEWGEPAEGEGVIHFQFDDIKKTIPVEDGMDEWSVTLPPMKADGKTHKLHVKFTLDGELAHERTATNIIFGDVWYVAAPEKEFKIPEVKPSGHIVRMLENESKRDSKDNPSRYSVCVSRTPDNRFASYWKEAKPEVLVGRKTKTPKRVLAGSIGHAIAAKTGRPVGIIFMETKGADKPLKAWMPPDFLNKAPSLMEDYKTVGSKYPGNPYYLENVRRYINDWKGYWGEYIPEMIETKGIPEGARWGDNWGHYPSPDPKVGDSQATQVYNVEVYCFTPAALSGIVFLPSAEMVKEDKGKNYGPEISALANAWKAKFSNGPDAKEGGADIPFIYALPKGDLAPQAAGAKKIEGKAAAVEISDWADIDGVIKAVEKAAK